MYFIKRIVVKGAYIGKVKFHEIGEIWIGFWRMVGVYMIWGDGAFSGKGWKVTPLRPHIAWEEQGE